MGMGFGTTMKVGFSYLHAVFHKLPETSLENFYINSFGRKLYSMPNLRSRRNPGWNSLTIGADNGLVWNDRLMSDTEIASR